MKKILFKSCIEQRALVSLIKTSFLCFCFHKIYVSADHNPYTGSFTELSKGFTRKVSSFLPLAPLRRRAARFYYPSMVGVLFGIRRTPKLVPVPLKEPTFRWRSPPPERGVNKRNVISSIDCKQRELPPLSGGGSLRGHLNIQAIEKKLNQNGLKYISDDSRDILFNSVQRKKKVINFIQEETMFVKYLNVYSYKKKTEIRKIDISLASPLEILRWAERTLPNGKIIGKVTNADTVHYKTLKPQKGGLFCERIFGPLNDFQCACGKKQKPQSLIFYRDNDVQKNKPIFFRAAPLPFRGWGVARKLELPVSVPLPPLRGKAATPLGNVSENKNTKQYYKNSVSSDIYREYSTKIYCQSCDVEFTRKIFRRSQLGYIHLTVPVTHVWFLKGTSSIIGNLLGVKKKALISLVYNMETTILELSQIASHYSLYADLDPSSIFKTWKKISTRTSLTGVGSNVTPTPMPPLGGQGKGGSSIQPLLALKIENTEGIVSTNQTAKSVVKPYSSAVEFHSKIFPEDGNYHDTPSCPDTKNRKIFTYGDDDILIFNLTSYRPQNWEEGFSDSIFSSPKINGEGAVPGYNVMQKEAHASVISSIPQRSRRNILYKMQPFTYLFYKSFSSQGGLPVGGEATPPPIGGIVPPFGYPLHPLCFPDGSRQSKRQNLPPSGSLPTAEQYYPEKRKREALKKKRQRSTDSFLHNTGRLLPSASKMQRVKLPIFLKEKMWKFFYQKALEKAVKKFLARVPAAQATPPSPAATLFPVGEKTFLPCISDAEHSSDFSKKRNKRKEKKATDFFGALPRLSKRNVAIKKGIIKKSIGNIPLGRAEGYYSFYFRHEVPISPLLPGEEELLRGLKEKKSIFHLKSSLYNIYKYNMKPFIRYSQLGHYIKTTSQSRRQEKNYIEPIEDRIASQFGFLTPFIDKSQLRSSRKEHLRTPRRVAAVIRTDPTPRKQAFIPQKWIISSLKSHKPSSSGTFFSTTTGEDEKKSFFEREKSEKLLTKINTIKKYFYSSQLSTPLLKSLFMKKNLARNSGPHRQTFDVYGEQTGFEKRSAGEKLDLLFNTLVNTLGSMLILFFDASSFIWFYKKKFLAAAFSLDKPDKSAAFFSLGRTPVPMRERDRKREAAGVDGTGACLLILPFAYYSQTGKEPMRLFNQTNVRNYVPVFSASPFIHSLGRIEAPSGGGEGGWIRKKQFSLAGVIGGLPVGGEATPPPIGGVGGDLQYRGLNIHNCLRRLSQLDVSLGFQNKYTINFLTPAPFAFTMPSLPLKGHGEGSGETTEFTRVAFAPPREGGSHFKNIKVENRSTPVLKYSSSRLGSGFSSSKGNLLYPAATLFPCGEKTFLPCISDAEHSSDFSKKRNKRKELINHRWPVRLGSFFNNFYQFSCCYGWSDSHSIKSVLLSIFSAPNSDDKPINSFRGTANQNGVLVIPKPVEKQGTTNPYFSGAGLLQKFLETFSPKICLLQNLLELKRLYKKIVDLQKKIRDYKIAKNQINFQKKFNKYKSKKVTNKRRVFQTEKKKPDRGRAWLLKLKEIVIFTYPIQVDKSSILQQDLHKERIKQSIKQCRQKITKLKKLRPKLIKRIKLVQLFLKRNTEPDSMVLKVIPVLPVDLRPITKIDDQIAASDLNIFYKKIITKNNIMKNALKDSGTTHESRRYSHRLLQQAVDNLIENGKSGVKPEKDSRDRIFKSLSAILKGKSGTFRQNLLGKRVDYSGRSVIVVGPKLKMHECGLPYDMAIELYLPFLFKRAFNYKLARTSGAAITLIRTNPSVTKELLREIMRVTPVLLNRAPTLHRLGIQAFQPKLVEGKAILLHPLVCPAFNADFDGDQMAVHVPITVEARAEALKLMFSRNNLLSSATGDPLVLPSQDMILGCYYLTTEKPNKMKQNRPMWKGRVATEMIPMTYIKQKVGEETTPLSGGGLTPPPAASYSEALFPCGEKTFIPCISDAEHSSDFSKKRNKRKGEGPSSKKLVLPSVDMQTEKNLKTKQIQITQNLYYNSLDQVLKHYEHNKINFVPCISDAQHSSDFSKKRNDDIKSTVLRLEDVRYQSTALPNLEFIQARMNSTALQSIIWLRWEKQVETGVDHEEPLEIRVTLFGKRQDIYSKILRSYDITGEKINQFIRTTPGKILFNLLIEKSMK